MVEKSTSSQVASQHSNTLIRIDSDSSRPLSWLIVLSSFLIFFLGLTTATLFWLSFDYKRMDREFRLYQLKIDEQNAILIREGLKLPGDDWYGPTSNPEVVERREAREAETDQENQQ